MSVARRIAIFAAILAGSLFADQATKAWALGLPVKPAGCSLDDLAAHRCGGVPQPVIAGYWDWELAMNDGAAFSNFRGNQLFLSIAAFGALALLFAMAARTAADQGLKRMALALIAAGAAGNLIDRVRFGAVVDFVRWRVHEHRWPIFNVADALLLVGVALMLFEELVHRRSAAAPAV
jgi:signal peptidase II